MAMIAVEMVVQKLTSLLEEEAQLLGGVEDEIDELRDNLETMKSFLRDAESRTETDEGIKTWVKQVRTLAYDAEDALDVFLLKLSPQGHGHGCSVSLFHYILRLKTRHRLALQIQRISSKTKSLSERRIAFSLQRSDKDSTASHDPRLASLFIDESEVIGSESPTASILDSLVDGSQTLTAISVVGMGGVGKTTLVKKVFDTRLMKTHFDCHAWITVSKSFSVVELLRFALKGFLESTKEPIPDGIDTMGDVQLVSKLKTHLHFKRYVVVFDDIWSVHAWESVKFAFPDSNCGSRLIFTTRINDVATCSETTGLVYHLEPLAEKESWTLFCKKAFRGNNNGVCPPELEQLSWSILKKCGGLPLAIVTIGGLLSKKNQQFMEWKKVHDCLASEMKTNSSLESLEKILLLSYSDLPYHLKICYLYLSVFPEDYLIKRMKVVRLWVVERFVEEKQGLTAEEVAEDYLNELVSRSLIQVVQTDYFGRVRTCRVHDLMREIIQLKSREESLVTVLDENRILLNDKIRRLSIQDTYKGRDFDPSSKMSFHSLRTMLVFVSYESPTFLKNVLCNRFGLLRVLELESAPLFEFPRELLELIHLRYLSLRRTPIPELPNSIAKLHNLEILDLKGSLISSVPAGILRLERLCQLCYYHYRSESAMFLPNQTGLTIPTGIGRLTSLQKLGSVEVNGNGETVREFGKLTQLRRLGILGLSKENGMDLCYSIEKLKHLTAMYIVSSLTSHETFPLNYLTSPPQFLQRLYVKCRLQALPEWIPSLNYLAKIVLQYSELKDDPLMSLQEMPNLVVLELRAAYVGEQLCCEAKGFPRLKKLTLYLLQHLESITFEKGAMPGLKALEIVLCGRLQMVPNGIEHLSNMQHLLLWEMPKSFMSRVQQPSGEDFWKVRHIPTMLDIKDRGRRKNRRMDKSVVK